MSWNGHECDRPAARQMAGSGLIAEENLGLGTSDITTVAVARAAADAAVLEGHVCDRPIGNQCSRGFEMADNYNATFGSTFAAFYASLPSSAGHPRRAING